MVEIAQAVIHVDLALEFAIANVERKNMNYTLSYFEKELMVVIN